MNLDDELRATLRTHAGDAPDGAATLSGVRGREHRIRTRQRIGGAGAAAAVAVALAVGVPYALSGHGGRGTSGPGAAPVVTTPGPISTTVTATPDRPSRVPLAAAAFTPVRFPLTPHWTPSVLAAPTVGRTVGQVRLVYSGTNPQFMLVTATAQKPAPDWTPTGTHHITVNGRPATLSTGVNDSHQAAVFLSWTLANGQWIGIEAGGLSGNDVTRYANGLTDHPMTPPAMPLRLSLAPRGWQPAFQEFHPELTPEEIHFCLSAANNVDGDQLLSLCVARTADSDQSIGGTPVQVGPDPGEITVGDDGLMTLAVHRPGFAFVVLENRNTGPLSQADLIRFAAGITQH